MSEYNPEDETPPETGEGTNEPDPSADQPEETTPEEPQVQEEQAEVSENERVTRLGVEYEVTPEHGHRRVR